jgi:hypothetical protein
MVPAWNEDALKGPLDVIVPFTVHEIHPLPSTKADQPCSG